MRIHIRGRRLTKGAALLALSAVTSLTAPASAEPYETMGGTVVLALSGLEIDLPALADSNAYRISASFALGEGGYDGRDVIDEASGADLLAGTWVTLGYFDAGGPDAVVAAVDLAERWSAQVDIWGASWSVAGGIYDFGNELGAKPALVACTQQGDGKALLIHRFFLAAAVDTSQAGMIAGFERAAVARAIGESYARKRVGAVVPMRRAEVRDRGDIEPSRWQHLESSLLELLIPDDGFIWLVRNDPDAGVDRLDRMAPAWPEVGLEVLTVPDQRCGETFESIQVTKRPAPEMGVPEGWTAGPQLVLENAIELTVCHEAAAGVVVVGIFQAPDDVDIGHLAQLLEAIAEAADVP